MVNALYWPGMFHSRNFLTKIRRFPTSVTGLDDQSRQALESTFFRHLPALPGSMGAEVFSHVLEEAARNPVNTDAAGFHQKLADLVDLFWMQYDDQADPLDSTDWEALRDIVDEHAQSLDLELVQYVMERVVSHNAL